MFNPLCFVGLHSHAQFFEKIQVHGWRVCKFFELYDKVGNAREKKMIAMLSRKIDDMNKKNHLPSLVFGHCHDFHLGVDSG